MTSLPPKCSAIETTPSGIDIHALMRGVAVRLVRIALDPHQFGGAAADVEQDGAAPLGSSSGEQPITASVASVSRSITSSLMPVSAATRSRNRSALSAARQASVAISRRRLALRYLILSLQIDSAAMARSIAASLIAAGRRKCPRRGG